MIYQIRIRQMHSIGGSPVVNGNEAIFEQEYTNNEDNGLLADIEMQLDNWDEAAAKENIINENVGRLARTVGALLEDRPLKYHPGEHQVEYDGENEVARFIMGTPDGSIQVTINLR